MVREKRTKEFFIKLILIIIGSGLIIMMVAQPLFVTGEYTPYSIRGGTGEKESTGLDIDYATKWSLHPAEMLNWVMPRFFGGTSGEIYTGSKVSQLKGRQIPGYWGHMPFTQAYEYIGVVLLFMSILGLILNFKNGFVKTLFALFLLSLFLSFGRHFPLLYNLFFKYVPQFNRFRVPAMISVIMQLIIVIWAGFGIKSLVTLRYVSESTLANSSASKANKSNYLQFQKIIIGIAIFLIILGLIPLLFGNSFSLVKAGEENQYKPEVLPLIKSARLDMMRTDGLRLILFSVLTGLLLFLFVSRKIKSSLFLPSIIILLLIDQIPYVKKAEGELHNPVRMEKEYFRKSATDKILLQDTTYYRVFPITENPFNTNDWSYYHNSIGGYSAAKLRIYQDIIENCLYKGKDPQFPINWNILKMLNTKYIISKSQLPANNLSPYYYDKTKKLFVYKTDLDVKPAWFVGETQIIPERLERFTVLTDKNFDAFSTAILEKSINKIIQKPDSSFVKVETASFNRMKYEIYTDKPTLFVVSEIYYSPDPKRSPDKIGSGGWKCFIDGKEAEIYKTNHILRSVFIDTSGEHEILFEFVPETFIKYYHISVIGHIIAYLCLISASIITIRKKVKNGKGH